jgi:putative phosphoribosyl transferase
LVVGAVIYRDRAEAGRRLAESLRHLEAERPIVLGLPRGGVVVASEVASALGAPLDVILVRKLGVPFQPELAMGAIGEGGVLVVNAEVVRGAGLGPEDLEAAARAEQQELDRRARRYRSGRPPLALSDRVVIVVDDGIATGSTARAACEVARGAGSRRVVLAAPVGPPGVAARFADLADEVVCPCTPASFFAIGEAYGDFSPTSDDEVVALLAAGAR